MPFTQKSMPVRPLASNVDHGASMTGALIRNPIPAYDVNAPLACIARVLLSRPGGGLNPTGLEGDSVTGGVIDEPPSESMYVYQ